MMKNFLGVGFMLATAGSAQANFLCQSADEAVKIQTFELSAASTEDDVWSFAAKSSAAILKLSGDVSLLTGIQEQVLDRVGGRTVFSLKDSGGADVSMLTTRSFRSGPCTRAGCDFFEVITATLSVQGTTHALNCTANSF